MVLLCNNKVLSIEQWHKNRCAEKNEKYEILMKMRHDKENEKEMVIDIVDRVLFGKIKKEPKNAGTFKIKTENYDCKKNHV